MISARHILSTMRFPEEKLIFIDSVAKDLTVFAGVN